MPRQVKERPHLPLTKTRDPEVRTWGNAIIRVLSNMFMEIGVRLNGSIHKDGEIAMEAPFILGTYASADLPAASDWQGAIVVVSDASAEDQFRYSDGTAWRTFPSSSGGGGSVSTSDIQDNAVTFPKIQNIASNRMLGRSSGGTGNVESLTAAAARGVMGLSSSDTPEFLAIELGNNMDTTLTRSSAGRLAVEGQDVVYVGEVRDALTADRTYYVRTDGSDSNNGLTDTAGGAFLTIQKAIDTVAMLDLSIYDVTINVADGTYTGAIVLKTLVGAGTCYIVGNTGTPSNVLISVGLNNAISGTAVGNYHLEGFKIETTNRPGINIAGSLYLTLSDIDFGAVGVSFHLRADGNAVIQITGSYEITGGAGRHYVVTNGGRIAAFTASTTITLTGTPAFGTAFADVTRLSGLNFNSANVAFSGAATGKRFEILGNSFIDTNDGGLDYFPGDADGTMEGGSAYDDITVIDASGNSSDGYYERDENGKLVQWKQQLVLSYLNAATCRGTWTFPTEFDTDDYVVIPVLRSGAAATPSNDEFGLLRAVVNATTTSVDVDIFRSAGATDFQAGDTVVVDVYAVGRYA